MSNDVNDQNRERPYVTEGIKEFDNPMPRWWVGLFYATIVFALCYLARIYVLGAPTLQQEFDTAVAATKAADAQSKAANAAAVGASGQTLAQRLKSPELIASGKEIFVTTCAPCHGASGEGNIGPNLTDEYWLHGGKAEEVVNTITQGAVENGMPPWGSVLGDNKIEQAAAFVLSLRGTHPANPKAPQGDLFKADP